MGGTSSKQQAKKNKKRVPEQDYRPPPSLGEDKPPPQDDGSFITSKASSRDNFKQRGSSKKISLLMKAKESDSYISKKDIMSFSNENLKGSFSAADATTVITKPLRDVAPPASEGTITHPAKWLWNNPDLTLCMDEHGNTYYYNYSTQESSWDPPEDLHLPKTELSFQITVPEYATPGEVFRVSINNSQIDVMCPLQVSPGMVLELSNDTPIMRSESVEEVDETNIDFHVNNESPMPDEGDDEGDDGDDDGDDGDQEPNAEEQDEAQQDPSDPMSLEPDPVSAPELPQSVDDDTLWTALAEVAGVEVYSIMSDADTSASILHDVANGSYFNELIYQVGWAYRFNLLKAAATACYLSGGDFLDSSQYDNCDGTPRYADQGFVEWLLDLQGQRALIRKNIIDGTFAEQEQSEDDYALLEKLSQAGDEGKLIEGLYKRRVQVDGELDNFRSRVMAVVSVEGGPSREALDNVFSLLKNNVQCVEEDQVLDSDEMEEEVSNYVQDRHRFVVDILLNVVLLEEELEILTRQIGAFELAQKQRQQGIATTSSDGNENGDAALHPITNATLARITAEKEQVEQDLSDALQALQTGMRAQMEETRQALHQKYDRSRAIALYVAKLLAEGVASHCNIDPGAVSIESPAYLAALAELQADLAEEESALEVSFQQAEQHQRSVLTETRDTNLMILQHEHDLRSLQESLQSAKEAQQAALRDRLAKRRAERVTEMMDAAAADGGAGLTLEQATLQAQQECATEEEEVLLSINKEMEDKLKAMTEAQLGEIKNRAEGAASRLEDSLNAQKSEQQRALMKRLERRRKQCTERIEREVAAATATATADGSPPITAEQKAIMLESALARLDSQAEAEAALLEQQNIASVRAVRAQMVALVRAEHEKECERLENELLLQKDKRAKELKVRLERKKAERAKELMNQKDAATENGLDGENESTPAISVAVAVALASEEIAEQEKIALSTLQAETDASIEAARKQVLDTLKELHDKESVRLEDDLLYQEKMQRANLANRLERQKKIKEKELLAAAHARAIASASNTTTASDNDTPFDLSAAASRAELQETAAASMELSIKEQVEREMQQIALQEEAKLQASLDLLKANHNKESEELHEELQYKRTSADKRLKERLALKQAKQAQQDAQSTASAAAAAVPGVLSSKVDLGGLRGVSIAIAPVLAALPEAEEEAVLPEVEVIAPPSDGSVAADEYTASTKARQKQLLDRLAQFIAFEKSRHIAAKQSLVKGATTKQKKEFALNELAHTSILFDHVSEFLALGLKKTFLYQTKAIKDLIAQLKPDCPIGESVRFSIEQMEQLESNTVVNQYRENACEKILERFQRDLGALVDSQALERRTTLTQMKQNGSSNTQLQASRDEMTEYHTERILTEVEKVILTITGVFIDSSALLETNDIASHNGNGRSSVKNSNCNSSHNNDSDNEDDDLDTFDAHVSPSTSASRKHAKVSQGSNAYGQRLQSWFDTIMTLLKLYATCPMAFNTACDLQCGEVKILRSSAGVALLDLSCEFRPQLSKPLLHVSVQSYMQHMRGGMSHNPESFAAAEAITSAVQQCFASSGHRANITTLFAQSRVAYYDSSNAIVSSPSVTSELRESQAQELLAAYTRAVDKFILKPVLTAEEIAHAQAQAAAGKAQETTSLSSKSGRLSGAEARKIQLISALNAGTERLKMEVREKYRKLGGGNEVTQNQEIEQLLQAQREVVDMISDDAIRLEEVNADGLIAVVERKAQGAKLGAEDVVEVQRDVQRQKQLERAQKDVQRVLQTASESENKLDVALKIEQAKRQQALHARLTVRRTTVAKK